MPYIAILLLFITGHVDAAVLAQPFTPASVSSVTQTSYGAVANTSFRGMTAANQSVYAMRAVQITKASAGAAMKKRAFTPWGFALVAAITAADMLLENDEIVIPAEIPSYSFSSSSCYANGGSNASSTGGSLASCIAEIAATPANLSAYTLLKRTETNTTVVYQYGIDYGGGVVGWAGQKWVATFPNNSNNSFPDYIQTGNQQVSDEEIYDIAANQLAPSQVRELFVNPITGQPNPDIAEFSDAAQDVSSDYDAANDADPQTEPTTNPSTYDTGTETVSDQPSEEATDDGFCKKYPTAFSCVRVSGDLDEVAIPEQTINHDFNSVSLSSSSTCPANPTKTLKNGQNITLDLVPMCDAASMMSPLIIAVCSLISLYILNGVRTS